MFRWISLALILNRHSSKLFKMCIILAPTIFDPFDVRWRPFRVVWYAGFILSWFTKGKFRWLHNDSNTSFVVIPFSFNLSFLGTIPDTTIWLFDFLIDKASSIISFAMEVGCSSRIKSFVPQWRTIISGSNSTVGMTDYACILSWFRK